MDHLASFLNINGGQKIAMLSMSVSGPDKETTGQEDEHVRPPKINSIAEEARIDCSWGHEDTKPRRSRKKDHLFAEINVSRGFDEDEGEPERPETTTTGDQDGPIISRWGSCPLGEITFFNFFLQDLATSPVKRMVCLHGLVRSCLSSFIYEGFVGISLPMAPLLSACV
jgi:hypothetical protein